MLLTLDRTSDHDIAQTAVLDLAMVADGVTASRQAPAACDIVEEWGMQSFPASDPPANW